MDFDGRISKNPIPIKKNQRSTAKWTGGRRKNHGRRISVHYTIARNHERGVFRMIESNNGHLEPEDFITEMKNRNMSIDDLILLYKQYERYNSMSRREVERALTEQ